MDIEVKDGKNSASEGTEISSFATEILPLAEEKILNVLLKI